MSSPSIAVIGLGYVGLPLALALARHYPVTGYDTSQARIEELNAGVDRTGEVTSAVLESPALDISTDPNLIDGADYFIITVPTPVDATHALNLSAGVSNSSVFRGRSLS